MVASAAHPFDTEGDIADAGTQIVCLPIGDGANAALSLALVIFVSFYPR